MKYYPYMTYIYFIFCNAIKFYQNITRKFSYWKRKWNFGFIPNPFHSAKQDCWANMYKIYTKRCSTLVRLNENVAEVLLLSSTLADFQNQQVVGTACQSKTIILWQIRIMMIFCSKHTNIPSPKSGRITLECE